MEKLRNSGRRPVNNPAENLSRIGGNAEEERRKSRTFRYCTLLA